MYTADSAVAAVAANAAFDRIARLEAVLSDYQPDSAARSLRTAQPCEWVPIHGDLAHAVSVSLGVHRLTERAFDVGVGRMTTDWRERSAALEDTHSPADWSRWMLAHGSGSERMALSVDRKFIQFGDPVPWLDFGGIGKGLAADAAIATLTGFGIRRAMVDAGGDLALGDPPPGVLGWPVHRSDGALIGLFRNCGVATSGFGEQHLGEMSHVFDPRVGRWLSQHEDVTVIAPSAALADAFASAGCVLGADHLGQLLGGDEGVTVLSGGLPMPEAACQAGSGGALRR